MDDIFGETASPVRAEDLVGEGKKFKSVDDLARGKAEADAFIERLKAEKAESDRQVAEARNSEAELARLREELAEMKKANQPGDRQGQPSQPDVKDIDAIVEASITRAETRRTENQNIDEANRVLVEHFSGDPTKAATEVAKRAREMGLTVPDLRGIAARSPSAFKRLILGDQPVQPSADALARSTVGTAAPASVSGVKPGTREFYGEMLRKEPHRYMSPEVQADILKHTLAGTYVPD